MSNLTVKTAFRKTMAFTPQWVHRVMTEEKIHQLTKHLMSNEDTKQCLEYPERREMILAEHMKRFPKHAARVNSETSRLSNNPFFRDRPETEKRKLAEDMCFCYFAYGFNIDEYLFFDLSGRNSTDAKRRDLVSDLERMCFRFSANDFTESRLSNKTTMYKLLKDFYKRDAVAINSRADYDQYLRFVRDHSRFVEKAAVSSRGQGVRLIESPVKSGAGGG